VAPLYDTPLPDWIASRGARKAIKVIDVGANVGDTAVALLVSGASRVLCIEGHEPYLRYLEANVGDFGDRAIIEPSFVSDEMRLVSASAIHGTATIRLDPSGSPTKSFDAVLRSHPSFDDADLLKIDTDGYDLAVLRSARDWIKSRRPACFFEFGPSMLESHGYQPGDVWPLLDDVGLHVVTLWSNEGQNLWSGHLHRAPSVSEELLGRFPYLDILAESADEP